MASGCSSSVRGACAPVVALLVVLGLSGRVTAQDAADDGPGPEHVPTEPHEVPTTPSQHLRDPDQPGIGGPASVVVRGRFTSVQVNVNSFGNDVIGDAANEPSIAVDPTDLNRMAIGWRQFDTIESNFRQAGVAHTDDGGATWSSPLVGVLDPGQFRSDPVLASNRNGVFYYSSLSAIDSVEVFTSFNGGASWPRLVPAFGGDKQWMTVDGTDGMGSGHLYQLWNVQFSCCPGTDLTRSTDDGASFEAPIAMPTAPGVGFNGNPKWGTLDVGPDGSLYVCGTTLDQRFHVFGRSRNARDASVVPTFDLATTVDLGGSTSFACAPNPAGLMGQVWIASDHSASPTRGSIYMLGSVQPPGTDPMDVHFVRSTDGGVTWSAPMRINDDPVGLDAYQWFGTMDVAPNGRIDVIWNDTRNDADPTVDPQLSEVYYSYSLDGGMTWSANEPVTPPFDHGLGYPQQNKLGDYYQIVSDDGGGNLAYAATFTGGQDVYYVRLTPDCNGNGTADEIDVFDGVSEDCNGNLTPDECEPDEDCNNNQVRDLCETANNTLIDCNASGIPDECEIASGALIDLDLNGVPDVCECETSAPVPTLHARSQSRYLAIEPGNPGTSVAIRVTLRDSDQYAAAEGLSYWVGEPQEIVDSAELGTSIVVADLGCDPVYHTWSAGEQVHIFGAAIIPDARYEIRLVRQACSITDLTSFSPKAVSDSGVWGDLVEPFASDGDAAQPDFQDVAGVVSKFLGEADAPSIASADLHPDVVNQVVDFEDIADAVSSFLGEAVPYVGPTACAGAGLRRPKVLKATPR